jgi:hypothetical protein
LQRIAAFVKLETKYHEAVQGENEYLTHHFHAPSRAHTKKHNTTKSLPTSKQHHHGLHLHDLTVTLLTAAIHNFFVHVNSNAMSYLPLFYGHDVQSHSAHISSSIRVIGNQCLSSCRMLLGQRSAAPSGDRLE